jgi:hypothetical protein
MKKLLFTLVLSLAVFIPRAHAGGVAQTLPFLADLRAEVLDELTKASNNIAMTNDVVGNKKLAKTLLGALKLIDKTKTNYVTGAKNLGVLNKTLGRTAVSNEFHPRVDASLNLYVASLYDRLDDLEDIVNASYPGRAHDAAVKALNKLLAAIDGANTNANIVLALKALSAAAKAEIGAAKAAVKADAAPAPPSHFTATITGSGEGTVNFRPSPAPAVASRIVNLLNIVGVEVRVSGTTVRTRNLNLNIPNLTDGTTTYNVSDTGGGNANVVYTTSTGGLGVPPSGDGFSATSGSVTVTVNTTTKTAFGTFSFSAPGQNNPGNVATSSNGSFAVTWQ